MFRSGCSGASQRWVGVNRPGSDTGADTPPPLVGWVPRPTFDAALGPGPSPFLLELWRLSIRSDPIDTTSSVPGTDQLTPNQHAAKNPECQGYFSDWTLLSSSRGLTIGLSPKLVSPRR